MREERMRPVVWVGDSKKRLKEFPEDVQEPTDAAKETAYGRTRLDLRWKGRSGDGLTTTPSL